MRTAAGTPPFGSAVAVALLAGAGACLLLPGPPPWPWLAVLLVPGFLAWWHRDGARRLLGACCIGFALAGLHATFALARELPPEWEQRDAVVTVFAVRSIRPLGRS